MGITSVQDLVDVRNVLNKHTYPEAAEWHFANLNNQWTRRAFLAAGFGYPCIKQKDALGHRNPIFGVAKSEAASSSCCVKDCRDEENSGDFGDIRAVRSEGIATQGKMAAIKGIYRLFFDINVAAAVESAVTNATNTDGNASK